jgi:hypothetical protein
MGFFSEFAKNNSKYNSETDISITLMKLKLSLGIIIHLLINKDRQTQ